MAIRMLSILFTIVLSGYAHAQSICLNLFDSMPSRSEYNRESYEKWDPEGKYDFREDNPGKLKSSIEEINRAIESGELHRDRLIESGIVEIKDTQKITIISKKGDPVPVEFYEYRLASIGTSLYVPVKSIHADHQVIMLMLPGTGSNNSTGKTMIPVSQAFTKNSHKKKDLKSQLGDEFVNGQVQLGIRAYTLILDPPGNGGFGVKAADWFTTAEGNMLTLEHARLVIKELIDSSRPLVVAGRSQGGLQAMAYAQWAGFEKGVIGAIAVNPSGNDRANIVTSVKIHEDMFEGKGGSLDAILSANDNTVIDPKMWLSYRIHTEDYKVEGPSQAVITLMYSKQDVSYDMRYYEPWAKQVMSGKEDGQLLRTPDELQAPHDLWSRDFQDNLKQYPGETAAEFKERQEQNQRTQQIFEWSTGHTAKTIERALTKFNAWLKQQNQP